MPASLTLLDDAVLSLEARIQGYQARLLTGLLPLELVGRLRVFGITNLGQLYALDCQDLKHRLGLREEQIRQLEASLNTAIVAPVPSDKTASPLQLDWDDHWVRFNWPWLHANDPDASTMVPASTIHLPPPPGFVRLSRKFLRSAGCLLKGLPPPSISSDA